MLKPSVVKHRNYKNFTNDEFRRALLKELSLTNLQKGEFDRCKYLVARAKKVLLFPEISQLKFLLPLTCPHIQMCISIRRYIYIYIYILIKTHTHTHTHTHCVKSVQIRSFSGLYFPTFEMNTEIYGVNLGIQSECGKMPTRKNYVSGHFSRSDTLKQKAKSN